MKESESTTKNKWMKPLILAGIVVGIIALFQFTSLTISDFTPTNIKNFILQFGIWSPIIFIIIYALHCHAGLDPASKR